MTTVQKIAHNYFKIGGGYVKMIDCWKEAKLSFFADCRPDQITLL